LTEIFFHQTLCVEIKGKGGNKAMIHFLQQYLKEIAAVACVFVAYLLNQHLKPRAKLIYGVRDETSLLVEEPLRDANGNQIAARQILHTTSLSITNVGKETAKNVEITFNWKPQFLNVWPARHFEERPSQHERHTIFLESMAPAEMFGIDMMSINRQLPMITVVRSDECEAKKVEMEPTIVHPKWFVAIVAVLMVSGLGVIFYAIISLIDFIFFR
jgi:hypothetical protein